MMCTNEGRCRRAGAVRVRNPRCKHHVSERTIDQRGDRTRGVGGGETATGVIGLKRPKTVCTWVRMGAEVIQLMQGWIWKDLTCFL